MQKFLHDLSTPLTVALFHVQAAREKVDDPEVKSKLEKAEEALTKIWSLVDVQKAESRKK